MSHTTSLGIAGVPDNDQDPFDELVVGAALDTVNTLLAARPTQAQSDARYYTQAQVDTIAENGGARIAANSGVRARAMLTMGSAQGVLTGTVSGVNWSTSTLDTDGFVTGSWFTIPAGLGGVYVIGASCVWDPATAGGRAIGLYVNGSPLHWIRVTPNGSLSEYTACSIVLPWGLAAGDVVKAQVWQSSGATITLQQGDPGLGGASRFWLMRMSAL